MNFLASSFKYIAKGLDSKKEALRAKFGNGMTVDHWKQKVNNIRYTSDIEKASLKSINQNYLIGINKKHA